MIPHQPRVVNPETRPEARAFMQRVLKRFDQACDCEREVRSEALIDLKFRVGQQWDDRARQIRDDENRPCLTINRIPQYIHQVTNEQRQQRPSLVVSPAGGVQGLDEDFLRMASDVWQGLLRHIEVRSDAECAYDTAFDSAVGSSFGWWRIKTEYAGPDSFDQELLIERILDPFSVYIDPGAVQPDRSDMNWGFVTSRLTRDDFKRLYPGSPMTTMGFFDLYQGGPGPDWIDEDTVQIAEYWERTYRKRILQQLSFGSPDVYQAFRALYPKSRIGRWGGNTVFKDEYELIPGVEMAMDEDNAPHEREVDYPEVKQYVVTGVEVLEKSDWPGLWIPLVPVFGSEVIVQGKRQLISLTRFIRDSQKLYNFFRSQQAEAIALTPKAPFIGYVGQFKTHENRWRTANQITYAYLEADMVTVGGQAAPLPQRNVAEPPIQAINEAAREANDDLKAGTGIYDASLGRQSNETSGKAILARQSESDTANFHFLDNLRRSMRHNGRILMDLIPHIYDRAERIIQIVKPDNTQEAVMINGQTNYKGQNVFFDPDIGRFDISVEVGPSVQSKLEQTWTLLTAMVQSNPGLMQVAGDLIMRSAPLPGSLSSEIADRLKAMLPPAIAAVANGDKPKDPQMEQQLMQASQMINSLVDHVKQLQTLIDTKSMELESKERIAAMQAQVQLILADLKAGASNAQALAALDFQAIGKRLDLLHEGVSLDMEIQRHERDMAQPAPQPGQGGPATAPAQQAPKPGGGYGQAQPTTIQ